MTTTATPTGQRQFPCVQCGGALVYEPGTLLMICTHCGSRTPILVDHLPIERFPYDVYADGLPAEDPGAERVTVKCTSCGAETQLGPGVTADHCVFCGSPVVAQAKSRKLIKPHALLPFIVSRKQAEQDFKLWISGLWFAPSDLKKRADCGGLIGLYIPSWTYDSDVRTQYTGERGDDYQEVETYTEYVNGRAETRTRTVTKTRWWPCSGMVGNQFRDLLIIASTSLPPRQANHLQPWDLPHLIAYADEFLSGFAAESYQVDLRQGFEQAKQMMIPTIRRTIEGDIGGDHQRIFNTASEYLDTMFTHILLPMWISAYSYNRKSYRFLINARTGAVQGERPYSAWKITALVLAIIAVIVAIYFVWAQSQH